MSCTITLKKKRLQDLNKRVVMEKKRKEFLNAILDYCEYWEDKPDNVYGLAFSILAMCDGCSSANNFEIVDIKGITEGNRELHDDFCKLRRERNEKV